MQYPMHFCLFCFQASGKFLAIDTINITPPIKQEIDSLTDNGKLIEACIATHPYHTVFFLPFYKLYPNCQYYGAPRHLRTITEIPWAGAINENFSKWEPEVMMRIPAGSDFETPGPDNHFSSVFVYHAASKTIHDDDTVCYFPKPGLLLRGIFGAKAASMTFHPTLTGVGLHHTAEAPLQFKEFIEKVIQDWDFENICTAHNGNKIGGAKAKLQKTLVANTPTLLRLSEKYGKK